MKETLCRRRCLLKIPKNYTGFEAETNVFAEHSGQPGGSMNQAKGKLGRAFLGLARQADRLRSAKPKLLSRRKLKQMKTTISLLVLVLAIGPIHPAWAESDPAVLTAATSFFIDYNQHDIEAVSTLFVEEPSITDAFPPFHWEGKGAFSKWMADLDNFNTANKYTDYDFKPGKPLSQDVEGERANVVIPVVLDFKHDGKPDRFDGLVNVVLEKTNNSWKIIALTWTTK